MELLEKDGIKANYTTIKNWQYDAFMKFSAMILNDKKLFPCIPASIGFRLNQFRYAFLNDPRENETVYQFADALRTFGEESKAFGAYTSLITIFQTPLDLAEDYSVDEYRVLFWSILKNVTKLDRKEWPSHIPGEPENHIWEYCFDGEQYFIYCATPAHKRRKSRSFPYFIFAVTPRWVLEEFHSTSTSEKVTKKIRERLLAYDSVKIHPDLNLYGNPTNFEWKQYFLSDDHSSPSRCPFSFLHKKNDHKHSGL
ncbi:hypothetical protein WQ54_26475 [Bacillus sp. SA1-12]|uniref:YqcI/YcgG family protein n=1 Tax=Bacillus sp. SA1-12 TaxID=1455638 RepID=UPI000627303E|nr:YqcI/YcgG family protein [Bacillus sp. SA1-12]KKI89415.1 hypothetical protein WQ54_26475 [Bacillus sp. SA1-12]